MSSIAEIQATLVQAEGMYSVLNFQHISELQKGCDDCSPKNYDALRRLIKALSYEVTKGTVDDVTEVMYSQLLLIVGDYDAPVTGIIVFGYSLTDPFGSVGSVTLPFVVSAASGSLQYSMTFPPQANLAYPVVREPSTEPLKTYYENTINNYGTMPDSKWRVEVMGSVRYYYGRTPFAFDAESMELTFKTAP